MSWRGANTVLGVVTALTSTLCYATANLLLRKGQKDTLPSDNGLFPILIVSATVLLFAFVIDVIEDPAPLVDGHNWMRSIGFCALSGIIATLFGRLALYSTISKIGATRGAIFIAMSPFVTLVIALTMLGEKLFLPDIVGTIFMFGGILFLVAERRILPKRWTPSGFSSIAIALCATLFQGIGYSLRKFGVQIPIDPAFAATLDTCTALFVYAIILGSLGRFREYIRYYKSNVNLHIVCAGFVMAAAVFLFFHAVLDIPVSTISVIMGTQPVVVALLAGIFMKKLERLTWVTFVSSVLVSIGVVLLSI